MEDVVYQFLLRVGYPRASIVSDPALLRHSVLDGTSDSSEPVPTFLIADPDDATPLAAVQLVDAIDQARLEVSASQTATFARRVGGSQTQAFVIRVDADADRESEQIQFFRVWPGRAMQALSATTFPDLASLRVTSRLARDASAHARNSGDRKPQLAGSSSGLDDSDDPFDSDFDRMDSVRPTAGPRGRGIRSDASVADGSGSLVFLPAALLLLVVALDWWFGRRHGAAYLSLTQGLMLCGSAFLFTLPALVRRLRS